MKSKHEKHKYVKLIEFALENRTFSIEQAINATKMAPDEFSAAKSSLFYMKRLHEQPSINELTDWVVKPEAYFSYLSYLEFKHAIKADRRNFWISIVSLGVAICSAILVTATLI